MNLETTLARMLHVEDMELPFDDRSDLAAEGLYSGHAERLLATPEGKALAALVEAAEEWRDLDAEYDEVVNEVGHLPREFRDRCAVNVTRMCQAIDAYREATK